MKPLLRLRTGHFFPRKRWRISEREGPEFYLPKDKEDKEEACFKEGYVMKIFCGNFC